MHPVLHDVSHLERHSDLNFLNDVALQGTFPQVRVNCQTSLKTPVTPSNLYGNLESKQMSHGRRIIEIRKSELGRCESLHTACRRSKRAHRENHKDHSTKNRYLLVVSTATIRLAYTNVVTFSTTRIMQGSTAQLTGNRCPVILIPTGAHGENHLTMGPVLSFTVAFVPLGVPHKTDVTLSVYIAEMRLAEFRIPRLAESSGFAASSGRPYEARGGFPHGGCLFS